jgi:hypothetical protein
MFHPIIRLTRGQLSPAEAILTLELFGNFTLGNLVKLVLSIFGVLWYSTAFPFSSQGHMKERWQRAFRQTDKDFKELFGVKKEIFLQMHSILTTAALERRRKGGRSPTLDVGDQLFLTLQYLREYRTMKHLAFDFGIAKSTVSDTIMRVENDLIKDGTFSLPGKKALLSQENAGRTLVVDVTESPIQRPVKKKSGRSITPASKRSIR